MIDTGISVYVGLDDYSLEQNLNYLQIAKDLGCEYVFSSAHIGEAKSDLYALQTIIDTTVKLGMKLSLDISKPMMEKIKIPKGLYALRLDYGFTDEEIAEMSKNAPYIVELNASTISKEKVEKLLKLGLNPSRVRMSFNFYPKLYTGHDLLDVYQKTLDFKKLNMTVAAFLPSHVGYRPPMYEGLPTVESHRKLDLELAIEELKACDIDGIYFGDAFASIEQLKILNKHKEDCLLLNLNLFEESKSLKTILNNTYKRRVDVNSYLLRVGNLNEKLNPQMSLERHKFDVTIDNTLFKRYAGEINILLRDLPKDERVNVIGKLKTTDFILEAVKRGKVFKFIFEE